MLVEQIIADLQNLINRKITLSDIGEALGVTKQAIGNKKAAKFEFQDYEIKRIKTYILEKYNKLELTKVDDIETTTLDYYPDVDFSCGNGLMPFGYTKEKMTIPTNLILGYSRNKKYVIANAKSDSMMPEIKPNDLLIIRLIDNEPIVDNHIYVFCHEERLYCKYLSYNIGQVIVRSANTDYPTRYIEGENLETFRLCGEVCGHFRNYMG